MAGDKAEKHDQALFFQAVRAFIQRIKHAETMPALHGEVSGFLASLDIRYYACVSHVDFERQPYATVVLQNYPAQWTEKFRQRHYEQVDPILQYANHQTLPFYWDDPAFLRSLNPTQIEILTAAREFGLQGGYTVPLHFPDAPSASFSIVSGETHIDMERAATLQLIAPFVYHQAQQIVTRDGARAPGQLLTGRERQCLELVAEGKSDWAIATILGIRKSTVHVYVERAKAKLNVATRTQAVVRALYQGQIGFVGTAVNESPDNHQE
ncbi:MAG: helix-turn-helix transcriptional regulator [Pseudomonadota bacterium]